VLAYVKNQGLNLGSDAISMKALLMRGR
jgi:hypothetical protein